MLQTILWERINQVASSPDRETKPTVHPTGRPYFKSHHGRTFQTIHDIKTTFDWVYNPAICYWMADNPTLNIRCMTPVGTVSDTKLTCESAKNLYDIEIDEKKVAGCRNASQIVKAWKSSPAVIAKQLELLERDLLTFTYAFADAASEFEGAMSYRELCRTVPLISKIKQPLFEKFPELAFDTKRHFPSTGFPIRKNHKPRKLQWMVRVMK